MINMNSQEFDTQLAQAKKASLTSPVIVTEQGTPKHVLLSFDEFHKITSLLNLRYDTHATSTKPEKKQLSNQPNNQTSAKSTAELLSLDSKHDYNDDLFEQMLQKAHIGLKPVEFD